jgi:hypothetical protein
MRKISFWLGLGLVAASAAWGCGSDDSSFGEGTGTGGGNQDGSTGGAAGNSSGGSAGMQCNGEHPIVDGGDRRCGEGECRCLSLDMCFPEDNAARCCDGELECFREGGKFDCKGSHPIVDGGTRYCEEGACYCESRDACLPAEKAKTCCPEPAKCG